MDGNKCALGKAYVCSANDECGANNSDEIAEMSKDTLPDTQNCHFVRRGILSKLVIFGDKLYGNVAGPSDTEKTLVQILAGYGEAASYRRSWRENY
jgi:type IV pilus assembly protein PilY1